VLLNKINSFGKRPAERFQPFKVVGDGGALVGWDRRSVKTDTVTGREVPDESKRVPLLTYANPRPAPWPEADFIVGKPLHHRF